VLLAELVSTTSALRDTRSRKRKAELLAVCIRHMAPDEVATGVSFMTGVVPGGKIGVGWAGVRDARGAAAAAEASPVCVPARTTSRRSQVRLGNLDMGGRQTAGEAEREPWGLLCVLQSARARYGKSHTRRVCRDHHGIALLRAAETDPRPSTDIATNVAGPARGVRS